MSENSAVIWTIIAVLAAAVVVGCEVGGQIASLF
jgi:hypothetical protein